MTFQRSTCKFLRNVLYILGWDSLVINRFNCREFPKPMGFKLLARVFQLPKKLLKVSFHWMVENWICVPSLVFVSNTGKPPTIMTWHICRFSEKSVISFRLLNKDIALSSFMHSEIVVQVQDFKVGLRWRFPVRNKPITEPIRRAPKSASFCLETSSKKKKKTAFFSNACFHRIIRWQPEVLRWVPWSW